MDSCAPQSGWRKRKCPWRAAWHANTSSNAVDCSMRSLMATVLCVSASLLLARFSGGQEDLFRWTLDKPRMKHWRKRDNCALTHVSRRGGALEWTTTFGEVDVGWASYRPPETLDMSGAGRVSFWVKGDGSGHLLHLKLGHIEAPRQAHYFVNTADRIKLDFTQWRHVTFALENFVPPVGRNPRTDIRQLAFIEFYLTRAGDGSKATVLLDDVRVLRATSEEVEAVGAVWDSYARAFADDPRTDGSNVLPNAGFELDVDVDCRPDLWRGRDWGTGSEVGWDATVAHTGTASARVQCASDAQRGSFSLRPPVGPGTWRFQAWFRTLDMQAEPKRGPVARLIAVDDSGSQCGVFHAYGKPTGGRWRKLEVAFELPAEAERINLNLFNLFASGTVWWDDVSLRFDLAEARRREQQRRLEAERAEDAAGMIEDIAEDVRQLPETTTSKTLKKAVLDWAIEDARASLDAGLGTSAKQVLLDVQAHLTEEMGQRGTPPDELLPPVTHFSSNPYVKGLLGCVHSLLASETLYKKGDEGYDQIENAWHFRRMGNHCYVATWALCYPESPYAGNPKLLTRVLRLMQAIFQNHRNGDFNPGRDAVHGSDANINRFCFVPTFEAYLLLQATYPDLILPSKRAEWLASARVATELQIETYGVRADREPPDCYYPNMDVHYMLMLELAARMFDSERYHKQAERFCQLTAAALYPDGAFAYHGFQNECFTYHKINVAHLARYWQLTGSQLAHDTVVKSRPYYPYNLEPGGVPEYYTDCFWKHYWSDASPIGPEIVAGITGCPHNRRLAEDELRWETPEHYYAIYAATLYRPDIKDETPPDNFLIYDRNIQGPRGRFGRWSFAGTARTFGEGYQGKDTFVGGMVVDEPTRHYPLNAALQVVTSQYRIEPRESKEGESRRWRQCRYLSARERNAVTIAEGFATLTTRYRIQNVAWGGKSTLTQWTGNQQWILTPERLIGLLEIGPLTDQEAYSIHGRIRFGLHRDMERQNDSTFRYGALLCRLHEHNYADVITEKSETFYLDEPYEYRSEEIVLRDEASVETDQQKLLTYDEGTRQFFTLEVLPQWSQMADSVQRFATPEGLRGLEVRSATQCLLLVHNTTDQPLDFERSLSWSQDTVWLHRSGKRTPDAERLEAADGHVRVSIAPHSHVVFQHREES